MHDSRTVLELPDPFNLLKSLFCTSECGVERDEIWRWNELEVF